MIKNNVSKLMGERLVRISQVARESGVSRSAITNLYYRRSTGVTFEVLDRLCRYFNCTVEELFEYVEK